MSNTKYIRDRSGKVIGRVDEQDSQTVYSDSRGRVVARVIDNRTIDESGRFVGFGDQGMGLIYEAQS